MSVQDPNCSVLCQIMVTSYFYFHVLYTYFLPLCHQNAQLQISRCDWNYLDGKNRYLPATLNCGFIFTFALDVNMHEHKLPCFRTSPVLRYSVYLLCIFAVMYMMVFERCKYIFMSLHTPFTPSEVYFLCLSICLYLPPQTSTWVVNFSYLLDMFL